MLIYEPDRTDAILTKPEGETLMHNAWTEAIESTKNVDSNFSEAKI